MINRSAAMALFIPLLLVLPLTTGGQANTDELSTSRRAILGPSPLKGYEPPEGPPASTGGGQTNPDELSTSRRAVPGPSPSKGNEPPEEPPTSTGGGQANTGELSTSRRAIPGPSPPKGCEPPEGPPASTGSGQDNTNELSTSCRAILGPSLPKGYKPPEGPPASTSGHPMIKVGACFPNKSNALSCLKRCMNKGYAGGRCDVLPESLPGDCFCLKSFDSYA